MNKKLTGIFAMCALLLTGCQGAKESSKEITPPDTGWGKTVDEVLADWNLDRDQVEIFSETESAAAIAVDTEATVFGEQTSRVMFQFINLDQTGATGKPVLCEVDITYPDDADMDTVKKRNGKILRKFQRLHYPLRAVPVAGRRSAPGIHLQKSRSAFRLVRREPERCDSFR